eukprot:gnl/TRDRNA2_/TRDRNA2_172186_c0_seq4.p1 gnl/TRDRNA2_/TRDRNA2_172186_c0~~gnl/TRDRNA2_/TRDRNA2_172186_c0_seq4.p1  ORF type:complete len:849 (+),score=107.03 gnl/TRDRNA2_/TRDRNA2_172186_c0_seq4:197-2548(+)
MDRKTDRIHSRLLQVATKFRDGSDTKLLTTDMIIAQTNQLCRIPKFTEGQVATIQLQESLMSIDEEDAATLIAAGGELAPFDSTMGKTAAELAVDEGDHALLLRMLHLGLTPSPALLHRAIAKPKFTEEGQEAYLAVIFALLRAGADVNSTTENGQTVLMAAAEKWHTSNPLGINPAQNALHKIIKQFLKLGADPYRKDQEGRTLHDYAARSHNFYLLKWMLTKYPPAQGASPYLLAADNYGQTLLHHVVSNYLGHTVMFAKGSFTGISDARVVQGWKNDCLIRLAEVTAKHSPHGTTWKDKAQANGVPLEAITKTTNDCGFANATLALVLRYIRGSAKRVPPPTEAPGSAASKFEQQQILERELNRLDSLGRTPLHLAAMGDVADAVQALLAEGAKVQDHAHLTDRGPSEVQVATDFGAQHSLPLLIAAARNGSRSCGAERNDLQAQNQKEEKEVVAPQSLPIAHQWRFPRPPAQASARNADADEWAAFSGWRQAAAGVESQELKALRNYGCDVDIDIRENLTWLEFRDEYVNRNRPVIVVNPLLGQEPLPAVARWRREALLAHYGAFVVTPGVIPYAEHFEIVEESPTSTIGEFVMAEMPDNRTAAKPKAKSGKKNAWRPGQFRNYIFDNAGSVLRRDISKDNGKRSGLAFVNASEMIYKSFQWYLGPVGSGAPVHFHDTAVNYIVYGTKHWFLIPPAHARYMRKPIGLWVREDLPQLEAWNVPVLRCVQHAGTAFFVPRGWSHGVLNLEDTIGFANEFTVEGATSMPPNAEPRHATDIFA